MESYRGFEGALDEVRALSDHAIELLDDGKRDLANAITRSGVVLLSGYVEGFIRDLIEEAVDEISDLRLSPDALPSGLLVSVLRSIVDSPAQKREGRLKGLKEAWRGSGVGCDLDRKKLSTTGGNPTVETIEGLFDAFGLASVIDRLSIDHFGVDSTFVVESQASSMRGSVLDALGGDSSRVEAVLSIIDEKWRPKQKRRDVGYVSALQELLKRRNRIAHGEGKELVTPPRSQWACATDAGFGGGA